MHEALLQVLEDFYHEFLIIVDEKIAQFIAFLTVNGLESTFLSFHFI